MSDNDDPCFFLSSLTILDSVLPTRCVIIIKSHIMLSLEDFNMEIARLLSVRGITKPVHG